MELNYTFGIWCFLILLAVVLGGFVMDIAWKAKFKDHIVRYNAEQLQQIFLLKADNLKLTRDIEIWRKRANMALMIGYKNLAERSTIK